VRPSVSPKRTVSAVIIALALISATACSASTQQAAKTATTAAAPATPTVYPVPEGCPAAQDVGKADNGSENGEYLAINEATLDYVVPTALPEGGCAYFTSGVQTSNNSSSQYRNVAVWFFNLDTPNRLASATLAAWAVSAGGTLSGKDYSLPDDFTGWTHSRVETSEGGGKFLGDQSVIPAYTQGKYGSIAFAVNVDDAASVISATKSGVTTYDPSKALSLGFAVRFSGSFTMTDELSYTAKVVLKGTLPKVISDVSKAPPGKFYAVLSQSATVTVTNTTSGRDTQTSPVVIMAIYPKGSAGCIGQNGVYVKGSDWQHATFCEVRMGTAATATLSPDQKQEINAAGGIANIGPLDESSNALAQLNTPTAFYAFLPNDFSLGGTDHWHAEKGCNTNDHWYVPLDGSPDVLCK